MSPWPGTIEVLGQTEAFDYVEFAAEYAPFDLHDLDHIARTAELSELATMVKIDGEPRTFLAQRAMAAGIQNILFADVRTPEDAREAVAAVRAEPDGRSGVRKDRRTGYVGGYASSAEVVQWCEEAVVALMIEKHEAMENLQDILAVEGVDMVQFGPVDYAVSIGKPGGRSSDEVQAAEERMIETALEMGVTPRVDIKQPEDAHAYLDMGVRDFNLDTDVNILYKWWRDTGNAVAEVVEEAVDE